MIRHRAHCDNRHGIRDPLGPGINDMEVFANTLLKTRIPDLFRTLEGLRGHAQQIDQHLRRLNVEGQPGEVVVRAIEVSKLVRRALKKAREAAQGRPSFLYWQCYHSFFIA